MVFIWYLFLISNFIKIAWKILHETFLIEFWPIFFLFIYWFYLWILSVVWCALIIIIRQNRCFHYYICFNFSCKTDLFTIFFNSFKIQQIKLILLLHIISFNHYYYYCYFGASILFFFSTVQSKCSMIFRLSANFLSWNLW